MLIRAASCVKVIVFDLDGTLVDSAPDLLVAANRLLDRLGRPGIELPAIKRMIGEGVRTLVECALAASGDALTGEALDGAVTQFYNLYMEAPSTLATPYPGAIEAMATLHERGIVLSVCTNKPASAAQVILNDLGFASFVSGLSGGDSAAVRKPHPGHVRDALARVGGEARSAAMVGDSEHDIRAGRAAGLILNIGVRHGYARVPYEELGADRLISGFAELVPTLEEFESSCAVINS